MTIPGEVLDSIKETLENVDEVESNLLDFLAAAAADPDALADLPPLQRARAFLVLAQAATTLLSVRLRCNGIRPDDHPIRTEIERISLCEEKLGRFSDWSKGTCNCDPFARTKRSFCGNLHEQSPFFDGFSAYHSSSFHTSGYLVPNRRPFPYFFDNRVGLPYIGNIGQIWSIRSFPCQISNLPRPMHLSIIGVLIPWPYVKEIEADPLFAAENGTIFVGDNASQRTQLWRSDKELHA